MAALKITVRAPSPKVLVRTVWACWQIPSVAGTEASREQPESADSILLQILGSNGVTLHQNWLGVCAHNCRHNITFFFTDITLILALIIDSLN